MKTILYVVAIAALMLLPSLVGAQPFEAEPTWVVDGDTFRFTGKVLNVSVAGTCRMLGYNAPEVRGPEKSDGIEARRKLEELLSVATVLIEAEKQDKYGRWLCNVWANGKSVNQAMRVMLSNYSGLDKYSSVK